MYGIPEIFVQKIEFEKISRRQKAYKIKPKSKSKIYFSGTHCIQLHRKDST